MSGGGGGNSSGRTVQTSEPWSGVKDALRFGYNQAGKLYNTNPMTPWASLSAAERAQDARGVFGGASTGSLEQLLGVPQGSLGTAIQTGIVPTMPAGQIAQQYGLDAATMPVSPLYGQASQAIGASIANPLGPFGDQAADFYGGILSGARPEAAMLRETAGGAFLGGNPYLDATYQAASRPIIEQFSQSVLPSIAGQFSASGRYGSGAQQNATARAADALGQNLAGLSAGLYGNAYEAERGRQEAARANLAGLGQSAASGLAGLGQEAATIAQRGATLAPAVAQGVIGDAAARMGLLGEVGGQQERALREALGLAQQGYGSSVMAPYQALDAYLGFLGQGSQGYGTTTGVTSQPTYQNRIAGAAGGALGGGTLGFSMGGPPGAVIGALLGGGLGLFG